jgi:hypothetical protein
VRREKRKERIQTYYYDTITSTSNLAAYDTRRVYKTFIVSTTYTRALSLYI